MYAEIDKQLKILKDFANDIQQHGPKIIWHGDTPDEHHEEQDFFVDNNNALSVSGLADNTLKLMNYTSKPCCQQNRPLENQFLRAKSYIPWSITAYPMAANLKITKG